MTNKIPLGSVLALACFVLAWGCKSPEENYPPPALITPALDRDPTQDSELGPGWSNGQQLLHLQDTHA